MPPLVDKPDSSSNYTFLLDSASPSLADLDSSQVTPSTITIASTPSNISTTESPVTASFSLPPSPVDHPMPSTSSGRPRSKSTRGQQPKKRVSSHIPRPPNAFILFRSSFIKSQQIPDKVEGNHSNLSKIIGHYWKALSPEERAEWEAKAVVAQEEHRQQYPDWRFRPGPYPVGGKVKAKEGGTGSRRRSTVIKVNEPSEGREAIDEARKDEASKSRSKGKERETNRPADDDRCAKIADLIREGKKGDELAIAVEEWEDKNRKPPPGSQMKASLRGKPDRLTPQSPGSPSLVSSPDRHSTASTSGEERSPDPSQSPIPSQSPSTAIGADSLKPNSAVQDLKDSRGSGKPPPKGISTVPLTQMFTRSHPETSPSTSSPSIADLCPTNRFNSDSSVQRDYAKAPLRSPSVGYTLPQPSNWQPQDPLTPYGSQSGQGSYWHWASSQSDLSQASSDKQCSDDIPHREMGYETDSTVMAYESYGKNFDSSDLPSDGSEATSWNTPANRHGLMAIINDPLDDPPPLSSNTFSPLGTNTSSTPHAADPNTIEPPYYYHPLPPVAPSSLTFPPTSYSTLTGWAGDYSFNPGVDGSRLDKPGRLDSAASPKPSSAGGWYPQDAHWSSSSRQQDHSMGMVLSPDDWDNVEDLDPRTNR
ncbi:hypothetical protein EST38_g7566 [Candolleomyces aberdarensis]|uniref:HMG box domain-containing protein n=1 Tax=Candolleomyces aberdarensis TaxID=2316362 RepID=A0A4Q2DEU0_9AGAR|nr:hypothetical protein EST38_g7566 [Candolleomyces aberdarensis]